MTFYEAIQYCIDNNLIFVAYRLPHANYSRLVVQSQPKNTPCINDEINNKGFLIYPFLENNKTKPFFIHPDYNFTTLAHNDYNVLKTIQTRKDNPEITHDFSVEKETFKNQVQEIIDNINLGDFRKVVLSRTEVIEWSFKQKGGDIFRLLEKKYDTAFVYVANVADQIWVGASPEPLLRSGNDHYHTAALAGTLPYSPQNMKLAPWTAKELEEQNLVTIFIDQLLARDNTAYEKAGPYPRQAGNLVHLCTEFSIPKSSINHQLWDFILELHPTSAVCGLPKKKSQLFLQKLEEHNRQYYSGFLGPINLDGRLHLFVNLRCMQIFSDHLTLYIGAGITQDSDPEQEWNETKIKTETLLSVIKQLSPKNN